MIFRLLAALFGFAVFAALFAGVYYADDGEVERDVATLPPKFRLAPNESRPDFLEPSVLGENITVNITVLTGGPIHVYVMDMENLTLVSLNGTNYAFEFDSQTIYNRTLTRFNVTETLNFTFVADGENRWAVVLQSAVPPLADGNFSDLPPEEQDALVTEVAVRMRYVDSEAKSLVLGYILVIPSVALVLVTLWLRYKRRGTHDPAHHRGALVLPRDKDL